MKHYQNTQILGVIAILLSIACLVFFSIYPSVYAKKFAGRITDRANAALTALENNDREGIAQNIADIMQTIEERSEIIKMFYFHSDISSIENAAHRAESILCISDANSDILISAICDIRESAENIIERDNMGWGAFM